MVTMNCILHTTVCLVHSPGAPPTSFTYLLNSYDYLYSWDEVSIVAEWALYSNHAAGSEKENYNA